jgi:hypothetical protein
MAKAAARQPGRAGRRERLPVHAPGRREDQQNLKFTGRLTQNLGQL